MAVENDVDAVVHTGDIFDDTANSDDQAVLLNGLSRLRKQDIELCYITGNHENSAGLDILRGETDDFCYPLSESRKTLGSPRVNVFGIDQHSPMDFPSPSFPVCRPCHIHPNILALHQTLAPMRAQADLDLRQILEESAIHFDLVVVGHLHWGERYEVAGVPVIYTGSIDHLSKRGYDNKPSAWLVTATDDNLTIGRQPL